MAEAWEMTSDEYLKSQGIIAGRDLVAEGHRQHSIAIYEAVAKRLPVPDRVLDEYPMAKHQRTLCQ
jgi:hypothetical protein